MIKLFLEYQWSVLCVFGRAPRPVPDRDRGQPEFRQAAMKRKRRSSPVGGLFDRSISLRELWLATQVRNLGSFRLAARAVNLTPSAVSRRVRALEDELGVSLFERRSSGVTTTDSGARFLDAARPILAVFEDAAGAARSEGSGALGHLVVASYFSMSYGHFRDSLLTFLARNPQMAFSLIEGDREQLLRVLRRGRADIAVLLGARDELGLERLPLWREPVLVAIPEEHRLTDRQIVLWSELATETFITTVAGSGPEVRAMIQRLLPSGHTARFTDSEVGREAMFNLVGAKLAVAIVGESSSGASYPGVVLRPVGDEAGPTMVEAAAYWEPKRDNPALRRFLAQLREAQASRAG
jgi:DNA-binding transcriptional LysR family regulator